MTFRSTTRTMGESATTTPVMNATSLASTVSTGMNSSRTSRWVFHSLSHCLVTTVSWGQGRCLLSLTRTTCSISSRPTSPTCKPSPWHRHSTCRCTISVSETRCLTGTASPKLNSATAHRVCLSNSLFRLLEWNSVATQRQPTNNWLCQIFSPPQHFHPHQSPSRSHKQLPPRSNPLEQHHCPRHQIS